MLTPSLAFTSAKHLLYLDTSSSNDDLYDLWYLVFYSFSPYNLNVILIEK